MKGEKEEVWVANGWIDENQQSTAYEYRVQLLALIDDESGSCEAKGLESIRSDLDIC